MAVVVVYLPMEYPIEPRLATPPSAEGEVVVQAPPEVPRDVPGNPLSRLLPVAMAVATVGMMALYFTSGASAMRNPMFMFFPVMMLGSLLGTVVLGGTRWEPDCGDQSRPPRLSSLPCVAWIRRSWRRLKSQRLSLAWSHPEPDVLWTMVGGRRMWERRPGRRRFRACADRAGRVSACRPRWSRPTSGLAQERDPVTSMELRRLIRRRSMVPGSARVARAEETRRDHVER